MTEQSHAPAAPQADDRVEIIDQGSARRLGACVESASGSIWVLRIEQATRVPEEAPVRWYDGTTAWQAMAQLEQIDPTSVRCTIVPPHVWELAPVRRSERVHTGEAQLLVRIVSSGALPGGRRVHTECLDASATGCRAAWPGQTPRVGDAVELTWDTGGRSPGAMELGWVAGRVVRVIHRPAEASDVCIDFKTSTSTQAARLYRWHQAWLQRDPSGPTDDGWD
jgi:hypothetical protein